MKAYIISAINLGADDYMTKIFSMAILEAKIKRFFERDDKLSKKIYSKESFYFDFSKGVFKLDEKMVDFTPTEIKILYYLIENENTSVTKDNLFAYILD